MNWEQIWNDIKNFFVSNGWNIVGFFATLFIGLIVIKILLNITKTCFSKTKMEKITQHFLIAFIRLSLYLVLVLVSLSIIGVQISGILTALSALVLAIGMALQNIIANLANGIVIVSNHMFKKGDFVEVDGISGSIIEINFLFTTIHTTDNKRITVPNSTIINTSVVNYGTNTTRRVDFTFSVAYESDVELVKQIVLDVMKSDGRVLLEPNKPFCRLKTLGASSIDFFANCWCDTEDYWDVYYYVVETVFNEFKKHNISIPYNQLEIRNRVDEVVMPVINQPIQERVEKERQKIKHKFDLENDSLTTLLKPKKKNKTQKKEKAKNVNAPKTDTENNTDETKK